MDAGMNDVPTDGDRYPTLSTAGHARLLAMREHPCAPKFRNQSGNRLTADDILRLNEFDAEVQSAKTDPKRSDWIGAFLKSTFADVPFYRARGSAPVHLADVTPVSRSDLSANIAAFVPDSVLATRMINFQTTGTTGHPLLIPSHPQVAGRYLSFHKMALARFGVAPTTGPAHVGILLIGHQKTCFTYTSVTPTMGESGLAKINLHPDDWRTPDDRATYINALDPEIIAGDPLSFDVLLDIPVTCRPKALMSVSMMLTDGLREKLQQRFGCPVLDIYSMNEVGPIAVYDPARGDRVFLQPRLHVEILGDGLQPVADGVVGEITVTGGFNFCLPLVRYRTGDFGALRRAGGQTTLVEFAGRAPVRFRSAAGLWLNNIDVSHALKGLPVAQFGLHQKANGAVVLSLAPGSMTFAGEAARCLRALLGDLPLTTVPITADDKFVQYSSAVSASA
jgi:phenylacetate-CoA ligase